MQLPDDILISRINKGDKSAIEYLYKSYYSYLCLYANKFIEDGAIAEEVVQEVFLKLWEKRGELKINTSIKAYLYRAVHNFSINTIKHNKVRENYVLDYTERSNYGDAYQDVITNELNESYKKALKELPEKRREIFELSRVEGLKYKEIADQLNISVKTVEGQMSKALIQLKSILSEYLPTLFLIIIPFL